MLSFALLQKFSRFHGVFEERIFRIARQSNLNGQTSIHCSSEKQRVIAT